ncbi:MAG: hypothetical protein E7678_04925 [Ruminococcaceae bacterium]|nr:hypothetical protein [Oscillospiraceae bacterium]
MNKTDLREDAKFYFVPFLLGNNSLSHKLSRKIYRKYKIVCFILDKKQTFADIFDFSSRFINIGKSENGELISSQLIYLANQNEYTLPLLIPCSQDYRSITENNREMLESVFVITNADDVLKTSPLNIIPQ